jgi:hypothetical protein
MSYLKTVVVLLSSILISGCGNMQGVRLLAPEGFGLIPFAPGIYIEASADEATRNKLRDEMAKAEIAIRNTYGSVKSRPIVNVCISAECYKSLGGSNGTVGGAFYFINRLLLSQHGINWHFLAHEWSHIELLSRLSFRAWYSMPTWFDEGMAVAISQAPEHSENHWEFLVIKQIPRPTREEMLSLTSLKQWNAAIHRYGEDRNNERREKGEPLINPVYAGAGHEIRPWLESIGSSGLLAFIARLNDGEDFELNYQMTNTAVTRNASP